MTWIEIFFWISFGIVFYTYLGYGILLYMLVRIKRLLQPVSRLPDSFFEPPVTLVVPCFNEAEILADKIANCKLLDYPAAKLHIIFITDGSTDNSGTVLTAWPEIEVLHHPKRAGKTAAENRVMKFVKTPVVIFSDANSMLNTGAVRNIVRHFHHAHVGCVSGEKKIISEATDTASGAGEGIYWKYESLLKKFDSELYSAVGAAGELVAFRSSLYKDLPEDTLLDDFMQSMQIAAAGYKIVYEPQAFALEAASSNVVEELKRKIRICTGGWQSVIRLSSILKFWKTPVLYFQYISHRVLRWTLTPFLLVAMFILNIALAGTGTRFYVVLLAMQAVFYAAAVLGFILENKKISFKALFVPYYFFVMNYAALAGLARYMFHEQKGTWDKAERKAVAVNQEV